MASDTGLDLRRQVIYSVFVRNYSKEGTFEALRRDLDRIQALGADIIWLMPIHPVGELHRKGSLGSPYAIRDYRAVNPEFGTMDDFVRLTRDIHDRGMKCIIDVVYNHTSPDSVLRSEHPDWFFHKEDGSFGNRVGDWWDVIDLDYGTDSEPRSELWAYQIETLKMWAEYVDGFRCDVAPMVPVEFWKRARREVAAVRPGCIWLAETVEPEFVRLNRQSGIACASDSEIYSAFDISYEYDAYWYMNRCITGEGTLAEYAARINLQDEIYPANYVKLRFLENHDRLRAHFLIRDHASLVNWTAFIYFQKGTTLIYAGQEAECTHTPSLFDPDPVDWSGLQGSGAVSASGGKAADRRMSELMRRLAEVKKRYVPEDTSYELHATAQDMLIGMHTANRRSPFDQEGSRLAGIFSMQGKPGSVRVDGFGIPDGIYHDLIGGGTVEVNMGHTYTDGNPVIFEI